MTKVLYDRDIQQVTKGRMMAQKPNERITRERIDKAIAFAKKGQYQKARYMLSDLHANPRAAKLLKQMEGRNDKFQGNITSFFNGTVLTIVALGLIVIFVSYNAVVSIRGQANQRNVVFDTHQARGIAGNAELYVDLVYFCYDRVGEIADSCLDWGEVVITSHVDSVRGCVIVDDTDGIQYRNQEFETVSNCFVNAGIPDPIGYSAPVPTPEG